LALACEALDTSTAARAVTCDQAQNCLVGNDDAAEGPVKSELGHLLALTTRHLRPTLPPPPRPIASSHCTLCAYCSAHLLILPSRGIALRDASLHCATTARPSLVETVTEGTTVKTAGAFPVAPSASRETATALACACPLARSSLQRCFARAAAASRPGALRREIVNLLEPIL